MHAHALEAVPGILAVGGAVGNDVLYPVRVGRNVVDSDTGEADGAGDIEAVACGAFGQGESLSGRVLAAGGEGETAEGLAVFRGLRGEDNGCHRLLGAAAEGDGGVRVNAVSPCLGSGLIVQT